MKRAAFPRIPTAGSSHSTFKPTSRAGTGHLGEPSDRHVIKRWETNLSHAAAPEGEDPFFQAFLDAVRGEGDPPNSNEEGLRFLEIQHALYRASDTGRAQRL